LPPLPELIAWFVILIVSLSIHEAAHAWTADRLGDPTARLLGRLTVNPVAHIDPIGTILFPLIAVLTNFPILGWAKPVPVNMRNLRHPRRDFAIVAVAGPISNLLIALVCAVILAAADETLAYGPMTARGLLVDTVGLNVLLAAFNMIPVPPLDGGNVLAGLVPESGAKLIDALRPWGFLIIYALLWTGWLWAFVAPVQRVVMEFFRAFGSPV
jgi:Zn-dependent protease